MKEYDIKKIAAMSFCFYEITCAISDRETVSVIDICLLGGILQAP